MICKKCQENNLKSKVFAGGCSSTLMTASSYYDEEGKPHYHDLNTTTAEYRCSNGHRFTVKLRAKCVSCDFNSDYDSVVEYF